MSSPPLSRRIFAAVAVIYLATSILFLLLVVWRFDSQRRQGIRQDLQQSAEVLSQALKDTSSPRELQTYVGRLGTDGHKRLTFFSPEGEVLADSLTVSRLAPEDDGVVVAAEIREARSQGMSEVRRMDADVGHEMIYLALRVEDRDGAAGLVRAGVPAGTLIGSVSALRWELSIISLLVLGAGLSLVFWQVRHITRPLPKLVVVAEELASGGPGPGDSQAAGTVPRCEEFDRLAASFARIKDRVSDCELELNESNEQLSGVLDGMSEGVVVVDGSERIVFANSAAGDMLGFQRQKVEGQPLLNSVRNHRLGLAIREVIETKATQQIEIKLGIQEPRAIEVTLTSVGGDSTPRVILGLHDVTQLRRLETLRRDFVANVSHELKTPLSSIKAYAETLSAGAINDTNNNLRFVHQIEEQAERLNDLIVDLMSLAQIESGQQTYNIQPLSVAETVSACVADYQSLADAQGVTLSADDRFADILVAADEDALCQILNNLIDNAVKYTTQGGSVTVRWRATESIGEIEVEDNGIGIAEENIDRLFERFFRVDKARSRALGGTGLGLAIVKHLAQVLGGSVRVTSQLGTGSSFTVCLPLA